MNRSSKSARFGSDPQTSVLDFNCKAHDLDNLYVVDSSFFPSSSAVNPGLTVVANALRVGDHLAERLACGKHATLCPACCSSGFPLLVLPRVGAGPRPLPREERIYQDPLFAGGVYRCPKCNALLKAGTRRYGSCGVMFMHPIPEAPRASGGASAPPASESTPPPPTTPPQKSTGNKAAA